MLWVILGLFMYALTSSMNMNESAVNMHMVLFAYRQVSMAERIGRWTAVPAIPGAVHFLICSFFI
jgi:hypothetical protein